MPPLATLLSNTARQVVRNIGPALGAIAEHYRSQNLILFLRPCALCEMAEIVELEPAHVALNLRLTNGHQLADSIP